MSSANGVVEERGNSNGEEVKQIVGVPREINNQSHCSSPSVCSSEDLFQLDGGVSSQSPLVQLMITSEVKTDDDEHDNICCSERGQTKTCLENSSFLSTSTSHRSDCSATSANSFAFPMYVCMYAKMNIYIHFLLFIHLFISTHYAPHVQHEHEQEHGRSGKKFISED